MSRTPTFRLAKLAELSPLDVHALYQLRVDVFVHEQATPFAEIEDADLRALHLFAYDGDALVACARLLPDHAARTVRFGRLATRPSHRGGAVAPQLIEWAVDKARELYPGYPIVLAAQSPLQGYYERFGFVRDGEEFLEETMPHVPMRGTF